MVQEPVNGGGGQCFGHDLVEAGGVQVARDGNRSAFVGSVDEAIESFGGVFRDREQTDVVDDDQVGADDPRQGSGDGVVGTVPADQGTEVFDGEPRHRQPSFDCGLPECLGEVRLASSRRPTDAETFTPPDPLQGAERVLGGAGNRRFRFVPVAEGLAGRETRAFAASVQVRPVPAGGFLSEENPHDFGGVPALGFRGRDDIAQGPADMGQFQAFSQVDRLGQRVAVSAGNSAQRGAHQASSLSSSVVAGLAGAGVWPKVDQAAVPGCRVWFSLRRTGSACSWVTW